MIKKEIIVTILIVASLFYMAYTTWGREAEESTSMCDPMEHSRLKVVLEECASGTMYDTWGR